MTSKWRCPSRQACQMRVLLVSLIGSLVSVAYSDESPRHSSHLIPVIPIWRGFQNKDLQHFAPELSFVFLRVRSLP
jgi:hypothetical protein